MKVFAALGVAAVLAAAGPVSAVSADGHGGTVDAGAVATMQPLTIAVSLPAEAHVTARSWLFMIETLEGEAVEAISVETSAQEPSSSADTSPLPSGTYVVRILFGSQIGLSCGDGIFYETVLPPSGSRTITIGASPVMTLFTFAGCAGEQDGIGVSVDTDASPAGDTSGTSARIGTFDDPLPPDTGTGLRSAQTAAGSGSLMLVSVLLLALALSGFTAKPLWARTRS